MRQEWENHQIMIRQWVGGCGHHETVQPCLSYKTIDSLSGHTERYTGSGYPQNIVLGPVPGTVLSILNKV